MGRYEFYKIEVSPKCIHKYAELSRDMNVVEVRKVLKEMCPAGVESK